MTKKAEGDPSLKNGLHVRNPHRFLYDFKQLTAVSPGLKAFVHGNAYGAETIDFSNPDAVKALNRALLSAFYKVSSWDIPAGYLCPPIPGRADYIHYAADLLASGNAGVVPVSNTVRVLDVGIGANAIYPIIGHHEYGWQFVGSDIDRKAIQSAEQIIDTNPSLTGAVACRFQKDSSLIFTGVVKPGEVFDLCICNPPFHASPEEALAGTLRKQRNLGIQKTKRPVLNFGGQQTELWCDGGEQRFISNMIEQSASLFSSCYWFTALVSKSEHLRALYHVLKKCRAAEVRTIDMAQGQKTSRILAWTFLSKEKQKEWSRKRWKA